MMIEVFKTNINSEKQASEVREVLSKNLGYKHIAFDLEDCDKILRIEASAIDSGMISEYLKKLRIACEVLEG